MTRNAIEKLLADEIMSVNIDDDYCKISVFGKNYIVNAEYNDRRIRDVVNDIKNEMRNKYGLDIKV